jgi:hypothetical protein
VSDVWFVVAGFTGILGGLTAYAATLALRLRAAQRSEEALRPTDLNPGEPSSANPE